MNERIKELALEAWITDCSESNPNYRITYSTDLTMKTLEGFAEKFAELIVKECALQCVHNEDMDLIEKHFGVEE